MALDDPPPPWAPSQWDEYINGFAPPVDMLAQPAAPAPDPSATAPAAPPRLTPDEEAQIEIDPTPAPLTPPLLGEEQPPPAAPPTDAPPDAPLPKVDAISGGYTQEQADRVLGRTDAAGQTSAKPTGMPDDYMTPDELGVEMSKRSPEEQAVFIRDLQDRRDQMTADRMVRIEEEARRKLEENIARREQMMQAANQRAAKLDEEARQLADQTPMDKLTEGQKLASVVAAIVGGFAGMNQGGGKNLGVDVIKQIADDAAQRHTAKMQVNARQRAGIADERAAADDAYRIGETVRLAVYDSALNKLKADIQQFDPRGTRAAAIMRDMTAIAAARADSLAKSHAADLKRQQEKFENDIKLGELGLKVRDQDLKEQQFKLKQAGAGAKAVKPDDVVQPPEYFEKLYGKRPPIAMSQNGFEQWAKTGKSVEDYSKVQRENSPEERNRASVIPAPPTAALDEGGNLVLKRDTGNLKQADGSDWIPNTPEEAKAFRKQKTAADGLIEILDEIRVIRDRTGGESSWGNSDDYQRLKVLKNRATKLAKAGTEGMSSDEDMKKIDAALGASDPASFRAQAAGLEEGRKGVERELDIAARNLGYTGKPLSYPDPLKARKAGKSPEQSTLERVLTFDANDAKRQEAYAKELGVYGDAFTRGKADDRAGILNRALESSGGILPSVKSAIDDLRETVGNESAKPKDREFAREALDRIAREAESPTVRMYVTENPLMPAVPPEEVR